jgi:phospholipid/cholesterol/gamma-HCH transport system substrate-binding protein
MITSRTKKQLIAFLVITLLGVTYVGAKYARLDRLFYDSAYAVNTQFDDSGGIFTGAEVTYRGVTVGQVSDMELNDQGVNVVLSIENEYDRIPRDSLALVGNKSAVGEQFIELQPRTNKGPYLENDSKLKTEDTENPVSTTEILTNLDNLVQSVPQSDLRTVVAETGAAFKGTGPDIAQIIDTSTSFIETANANFDTTTALIRDSRTVLQTQVDKGTAIRSFAEDLALFSGTVADNDRSLRALIDNGSATANELRTFLEQNRVNLGQLINNLVTTAEIQTRYLPGLRQVLVIYPYVVAGGFTVAATNGDNRYEARFGLILTEEPKVCEKGYPGITRTPQERGNAPMNTKAGCADPGTNLRGAEKAPSGTASANRPPVATYDVMTKELDWAGVGTEPRVVYDGGAGNLMGKDAWKWMLLQPSLADDPAHDQE